MSGRKTTPSLPARSVRSLHAPLYYMDMRPTCSAGLQRRAYGVGDASARRACGHGPGMVRAAPPQRIPPGHCPRASPHPRDVRKFFVGVRAAWRAEMQGDDQHPWRYLIEQLTPENFAFERIDERRVKVSLRLPDALQKETEEGEKRRGEELLVMITPVQCRQRLDKNTPLGTEELDQLWETIQRLDTLHRPFSVDDYGIADPVNGVLGGIAVLMVFHLDWLNSEPARIGWCREKLEEICKSPPPRSPLDSDTSAGNDHWDAFAAEAGVVLWEKNQQDPLARCLVANGMMAYRYATAALTVRRARALRSTLGDDFRRLVSLGVRYSPVRGVLLRRTGPAGVRGVGEAGNGTLRKLSRRVALCRHSADSRPEWYGTPWVRGSPEAARAGLGRKDESTPEGKEKTSHEREEGQKTSPGLSRHPASGSSAHTPCPGRFGVRKRKGEVARAPGRAPHALS